MRVFMFQAPVKSDAKASLYDLLWIFLSRRVCTSRAGSFPFHIVFMSANIPRRHVSYEHEQMWRMNTSWEHSFRFISLSFSRFSTEKKKLPGRKGWRVGIFSFSLEKRSDSLQLHLRDLIKLPWSGQHAWPLLRLWFDWCSFTRKWRIKPEWRLNFAPFRWNWEICLVNEKLNKVYIWVNWSNAAWANQ